MKKLIIDIQILQTPALKRGMGQYVISLINAIADTAEVELILVMSSCMKNQFSEEVNARRKKFKIVELPLLTLNQTKDTKKAIKNNKQVLNNWVEKENLHDSDFIIGSIFQAEIYPAFPDKVTKSAIMYDVIPIQLFEQYAPKMRWGDYLNRFVLVHEASNLFCISKTTANDLQAYANVQPEKITVINGGPGEFARPQEPEKMPTKKFVLMPTGNDIRKNNRLAVEAFAYANEQLHNNFQLVITSFFTDEEKQSLLSITPDILFTNVISDVELAWYFSECEALLFPSLYEGLGMPLIEAMVFEKTIVASKIDVFLEISDSVAYYFNPHNRIEMTSVLVDALAKGPTKHQASEARRVISEYSWKNSALAVIQRLSNLELSNEQGVKKKRIAVLGPHVTGSSAIGKFIAEIHPALSQIYDIDYFYERSPVDKVLRPDILGHIAHAKPVQELTDSSIRKYEGIIYHVGNSNHHTLTTARALRFPGVAILHDLHIENVYQDLLKRKLVGPDRVDAEKKLDELKPSKSSYLQSIVTRQKAMIVHSKYAQSIVKRLTDKPVFQAELAVSTPLFDIRQENSVFTIGLAGILAGIKGLETIERLAQREEFRHDKIKLFGLNFAEPGLLDRLRQLPNVEVSTDLSDFEFQQSLKSLDVLINFRTKYQGEASYATLEAMRYGLPVIVRGDFGWYAELPEESVIKVNKESDIADEVMKLKKSEDYRKTISKTARETTSNMFSAHQYAQTIKKALEG